MAPSALRRRVLLSGTMLAAAVGYGRRAYGACAPAVAPNYQCSGANVTTQFINANNASVSTVAGFSVNTPVTSPSITITGNGALSYTDTNASPLTTGAGTALDVRSLGDFAATPGSVTIASNGALIGSFFGIYTRNSGTGALTITANGDVTGATFNGIDARNTVNGTAISVTTGVGSTVGGTTGIFTRNYGTGALTITANGDVTGTTGLGILAQNLNANGTAVSVTTATGSTVSGSTFGIYSRNNGTGALTIITVNGTVTANKGIHIDTGVATVTVAGTVTGGGGTAIDFANAVANRLELVTGAVINGNVLGGTGTDTLGLSGTGSGSFNVVQLSSFEAGQKTGSGAWTLTGTNAGIGTFAVSGGTLAVNGSLASTAMTVNAGGTLGGIGTVGNTQVNAGGTFAPGSGTPGSSMTVSGTLGFNAASTFAVNVNPTTASF